MNNKKKADQYLYTLFQIKLKILENSSTDFDKIWLDFHNEFIYEGYSIENLPRLLALIHPDFYYKNGRPFVNYIPWHRNANFSSGISNTSRCQSNLYTGTACIFNSSLSIRGKCNADHAWPNSLGGPSIIDNRLILCKYHNGMKGNDVYDYCWDKFPGWLQNYLGQIYRQKL